MTDTQKEIDWNKPLMVDGYPDVEVLLEERHRITKVKIGNSIYGVLANDKIMDPVTKNKYQIINRPEPVKVLHGRYVGEPERGTIVYVMGSDGYITDMTYTRNLNPEYLRQGRLFTCRSAAEWYREQEKLMQELREFSFGHEGLCWPVYSASIYSHILFSKNEASLLNLPLMTPTRIKDAIKHFGDRLEYLDHWDGKECE